MHLKKQDYISTVSIVFLIIAIIHAARLYYGWEGIIGGWKLPMWLSWAGVLVAGYLSWQGFRNK